MSRPAPVSVAGPATCRYAGLAGSLLLAVAAYLGGARSPWQPTMTPHSILAGDGGVLLPLAWLLGTALLIAAWWLGRSVVPSTRWAYVTAALWVVPLLPMLPLGSYDVYSYACQGHALAAGSDPYAAGVQVLGCPWLDSVAPTWRQAPAPYGPVFLVLAAGAAQIGGSLAGTVAVLRIISLMGVVLTAAFLPVLARRAGVPVSRAVWLALACPLIAVHLVSGAHNDAVMVGLLVAGLAVVVHRDVFSVLLAAGALFGLAIGVKATAVVVLPFAVLIAVPPDSPLRALWRPAAALAGGAAAALAVVSLVSGLGFGWVTGLAGSGVSVQWTSPPTALGMALNLLFGNPVSDGDVVLLTRAFGIGVLAVVLVVLWWRARRGDALLGAGLALAATVLLAPVFHPWYATWPLAVLAATLPRPTLWLVAPCAVAAALCLPDGYNLALATKAQGAVAMVTLIAGLGVWAVRRRRIVVAP
jgi:alpha-1,6-mannosyltransferase